MTRFDNVGVFTQQKVWLKPNFFPYKYTYEDGRERVFQNVGIYNSNAGELPRRKHTTFRTRRKFEIKNAYEFRWPSLVQPPEL